MDRAKTDKVREGSIASSPVRPCRDIPSTGTSLAHSIGKLQRTVGNRAVQELLAGASGGSPLDPASRERFEQGFGEDLSTVRIHTGDNAARSAEGVEALAYAVGEDITFAKDQYDPTRESGRRLLAHELAHVIQQRRGGPSGAETPSLERFAQDAASKAVQGHTVQVAGAASPGLARQPAPPSAESAEDLERRLNEINKQLETGSGVRTNEATARLKEEQQRLAVALGEARRRLVQRELEANRKQQNAGVGVRSPRAITRLKEEEDQLVQANSALTVTASAPNFFQPSAPSPDSTFIDWNYGNLRGLAAENEVLAGTYRGALRLPKNYPAVDLISGGQRTTLTGFQKTPAGKFPFSQDSVRIDGGTMIQIKTMKNSLPYYHEPDAIYKELSKGMEKLANIKPDTGRSERTGNEYFRVEHSGNAEKKVLHVEMEASPTAEQQAQLDRLANEGTSAWGEQIEVVVNWPGKTGAPLRITAQGLLSGAGLALAAAGMYTRERFRQHQLDETGYAPTGHAAHAGGSFMERWGAFLRGDSFESGVRGPGALDIPRWRVHVRSFTDKKRPGETLNFGWQFEDRPNHTIDVDVVYEKQQDGTWRSQPPSDLPKSFTIPNLNSIIDPKVTDDAVRIMLENYPI